MTTQYENHIEKEEELMIKTHLKSKGQLIQENKAIKSKLKYSNIVVKSQEKQLEQRDAFALKYMPTTLLWKYIEETKDFRVKAEQMTEIAPYTNKKGRTHQAHYYASGFSNEKQYYLGPCSKLGSSPIITEAGKIYPTKQTHKISRTKFGGRCFKLKA